MNSQTQNHTLNHAQSGSEAKYQDGLLDLTLALLALLIGLTLTTKAFFLSWILPAAVAPIWIQVRQANLRRTSLANTAARKRSGQAGLRWGTALCIGLTLLGVLVALVFMLGKNTTLWMVLSQYSLLGLGLLAVAILASLGFVLKLQRFSAYAGLLLAIVIAGHLFQIEFSLWLVLFGGLVLPVGLFVWLRFIRRYPAAL